MGQIILAIMEEEMYIEKITAEMREIFKEIPYGIDHTLKVLSNAEAIMDGEGIGGEERELICIVTILHDIGAVEALHKYGSIDGVYQEKEGPAIAKSILSELDYDPDKIDRICYIIGNHHTPSKINGLDFQILWEADLIENLLGKEIKEEKEKLVDIVDKNFKTNTGRAMIYLLLGLA
jgi:urease accessory protein UreE